MQIAALKKGIKEEEHRHRQATVNTAREVSELHKLLITWHTASGSLLIAPHSNFEMHMRADQLLTRSSHWLFNVAP